MNLAYQGRYEEAEVMIRKELSVDTLSPETHYYLGLVIASSGGDYKEALKELEIAMQSPTFANSRDEFARNLYRVILKRAYGDRNKELFITAASRLKTLDPEQAESVKVMEEMVKKGQWPAINFQ
jgi:tetratricopeptide (TPR) repeat protein